ncbi:MAG TPA: alkaline phosphatase PhoX, partial [Luteibaculaceae bacterium]|nr:alkaline phosphatase PhoX [Luteibaculaceae bacterium]
MKKHYAAFMLFLGGHLAYGQAFPTLDTNFNTTVVLVPSPIQITPLFSGSASMVKKPASLGGGMAPAKQNHDYIGFVPYNDSSDAQLLVNHELRGTDNNLDDGGGMTSFRVKRNNGQWQVDGDFNYVDFKSTVGGTYVNCGGGENPAGLVTTAEEFPPSNNVDLFNNGYRDTSDYVIPAGNAFAGRTIKRFQNFGWMVEVDPATGKATQKYYKMGRFSHEGALYINDGRTVYLTDDNTPGVLFKFEAAVANDYTDGQLFAYKQLPNSFDGTWVALPME